MNLNGINYFNGVQIYLTKTKVINHPLFLHFASLSCSNENRNSSSPKIFDLKQIESPQDQKFATKLANNFLEQNMTIWPKIINSHDISIFTFKTENCIKFIYNTNSEKFNSKTFDDFNFKSLDTLFVHARVQSAPRLIFETCKAGVHDIRSKNTPLKINIMKCKLNQQKLKGINQIDSYFILCTKNRYKLTDLIIANQKENHLSNNFNSSFSPPKYDFQKIFSNSFIQSFLTILVETNRNATSNYNINIILLFKKDLTQLLIKVFNLKDNPHTFLLDFYQKILNDLEQISNKISIQKNKCSIFINFNKNTMSYEKFSNLRELKHTFVRFIIQNCIILEIMKSDLSKINFEFLSRLSNDLSQINQCILNDFKVQTLQILLNSHNFPFYENQIERKKLAIKHDLHDHKLFKLTNKLSYQLFSKIIIRNFKRYIDFQKRQGCRGCRGCRDCRGCPGRCCSFQGRRGCRICREQNGSRGYQGRRGCRGCRDYQLHRYRRNCLGFRHGLRLCRGRRNRQGQQILRDYNYYSYFLNDYKNLIFQNLTHTKNSNENCKDNNISDFLKFKYFSGCSHRAKRGRWDPQGPREYRIGSRFVNGTSRISESCSVQMKAAMKQRKLAFGQKRLRYSRARSGTLNLEPTLRGP